MSLPAPVHAAPGVYRLGGHGVNFYLIEERDGLILVDAGLPAHLGQLQALLGDLGCTLADVRAVLLTHGHLDHTGLAGPLQRAGADVWVHERDAAILRDGPRSANRHAKPERSMFPYLLRRPAALGLVFGLARSGAFTAPGVPGARVFGADRVLQEVPGAPQAMMLDGHTPGSVAYLFADRGVLFTGDALVTADAFSRHTGPMLVCRCFTHDSGAALAALDRLDALRADGVLLPGHGEPFTGGIAAAAELAREYGVR